MLAPAVFGFAVPAMAEDAPAEQQTAVVGQSENLTATVPVDDKGQAVITQHDDGTWWTSITITYSGPTTLDPMVVERNGVTISREPSLFLVASAQPAVGTANSQDGFVSAMEAWDLCRLEVNTRYLTGAVSLNEYSESQGDIQGEMVTCAENEGLGQVLTTDDETGGNSFAFEFIKEDARTFTYEVPVGNLGQHPWVGVSAYTCLWPDSYVRGELTAEQVATINQIGGAAREFNEGGTISRTAWVPCVYEAREFTEIEVSVPQVMAPLPGPKAEPGTSMHPSGFS